MWSLGYCETTMWKLKKPDEYSVLLYCAVFVTVLFSAMGWFMGIKKKWVCYYGWCFDDYVVSQMIMVLFALSFMCIPVLAKHYHWLSPKK